MLYSQMPIDITQPAFPLPITSRGLRGVFFATLAAFLLLGCAASAEEVNRARHAGYKTAFSTVYTEALAAVAKRYPRASENPTTGMIKTAWHPVSVQEGSNQTNGPRAGTAARGGGNQRTSGGNVSSISPVAASTLKRFFIRFRVQVIGGDPWRVRVIGEASEWSAGDVPLPLRGAEVPPWLEGRSAALEVDIYRRLKKYAVQIKQKEQKDPVFAIEKPASFGEIPEGAAKVVESVYLALKSRDMKRLGDHLSESVIWSAGSAGDAEMAIVMWQADTGLMDSLIALLDEGCRPENETTIRCDQGEGDKPAGAHAIFENRDASWVLVEYVRD